jgi:small redox-active disulfide protein 2
MVIKILGSGCTNCHKLEALAKRAAEELGIDAEIVKVTEYPDIMAFGIMSTPGLVVDEEVKVAGRVPSYDDVKRILTVASAG